MTGLWTGIIIGFMLGLIFWSIIAGILLILLLIKTNFVKDIERLTFREKSSSYTSKNSKIPPKN